MSLKDTKSYPKTTQSFISDVRKRAKKHGIEITISDEEYVYMNDELECAGFFDDVKKQLQVAAGECHFNEWFPIFIHESCHMDQWLDDPDMWNNVYYGKTNIDNCDVMESWLAGDIELKKDQLAQVVEQLQNIEMDCEQRVIARIDEYNLPVDKEIYIKEANIYVLFQLVAKKNRKWYKKYPGDSKKVLNLLPDTLYYDYTKISPALRKELEKFI